MKEQYSSSKYWDSFFRDQVRLETDRAVVILTAAMIDQGLEDVLRARLVQLSTSEDPLFDSAYAPLADFNAKIDLAFRIGLLPPNYAKGLHLIRRIRNEFAHNVSGCTFDDPRIRNRVMELDKALGVAKISTHRASFSAGTRGDFETTASWIIWRMWSIAESIEAIRAPDEWKPLDPQDKKGDVAPGPTKETV